MSRISIHERAMFPTYSRETYRKEFGVQAPPFDPNRPVKAWFDPNVDQRAVREDGTIEYDYFDWKTKSLRKMYLTKEEASSVNLTGAYEYPQYKPEPTPAVIVAPNGERTPVSPIWLSTRQQAVELANEIARDTGIDPETISISIQEFAPGPFHVEWNDEVRRPCQLTIGGNRFSVGALIAAKNAYGIGRPGKWEIKNGEPIWKPVWVALEPPPNSSPVPVPIIPLGPDEEIVQEGFSVFIRQKKADGPRELILKAIDLLNEALKAIDGNA